MLGPETRIEQPVLFELPDAATLLVRSFINGGTNFGDGFAFRTSVAGHIPLADSPVFDGIVDGVHVVVRVPYANISIPEPSGVILSLLGCIACGAHRRRLTRSSRGGCD